MKTTGERFIPGQGGVIELEHLNRYYFVVHQIDITDKTVLDIASGEGYGSNILAKHASRVIGVDISSEAIEHAKKKYQANNLEFIQGSVIEIPLTDNSVDVVVSFETLEHHDKHDEMMLEIKRILNNNGILIISSPDKYYYSELPGIKNDFHVKELYYDEFEELMKRHFEYTYFFSQRAFNGSMIVLNENGEKFKSPIIFSEEGLAKDFVPLYNIGIGTNDLSFSLENNIVIYQNCEDILTNVDIENAREDGFQRGMNHIRKTKYYRIGKFILRPFSRFKKGIYVIYHNLFTKQ
ncbi:MAG TPA: class I SAM-dependent methyltransferase [Prolixibacteraceae bacterium]|nr:class I SAM-dependent methyltransferase [Prolixibacteraceae bacterium]HOS90514.1 class I SAM-dependent methyltransferase [Prolixibacteraceae bacterium]HPL45569.1 class I SAM-dependent methyltransferase [Prolixibacteraceae bacterium]HQE52627.1 class I SAM-dependent methyltransferase [Prolixibacteraceae bacterium]HQJ85826.1 class I SAM-dependent methyltransferase [Prolixibacteraceae bacterium]